MKVWLRKPRFWLWPVFLLILVWALRGLRWEETWAALSRLNPTSVFALILMNIGILWLFNSRWWLILRLRGYPVRITNLFAYRLAAFGVSYFTPGPQFGGEPLQVYLLQKRHGVPLSTAVSVVTLDKLLELLANFAFLAFGSAWILSSGDFAGMAPEAGFFLALGLLGLPLGYLLALWSGRRPGSWLAHRLPDQYRKLQNVRQHIEQAEAELSASFRHKPESLWLALGLSLLTWIAMWFEYWLTFQFLGLSLDIYETVALLVAARLAFLMPVPGGMGTLEASQILVMQSLGYPAALAISAVFIIRGRDLLLGGVGLWWAAALSRPRPFQPQSSEAGD